MKRADALALLALLEADTDLAARYARALAPHTFALAMTAAKRPADTFSSRKGHGAPGLSYEENKRIARLIGTCRGRWWIYTAAQLEAYEAGQATPTTAASVDVPSWTPRAALESAGLRKGAAS